MDKQITVGIHLNNVTFSFKTDYQGSNVREAVKAIKEITASHGNLFNALKTRGGQEAISATLNLRSGSRGRGRAETSLILQKLDEILFPQNYFGSARTTGDVKAELEKETAVKFTSRKVSQALGALFKRGRLGRVGTKGDFRYLAR